MWRELWNAFCDWASDAWNWLKNFFKKIWEKISSWWDALMDTIEEWLEEWDDEVVIIDPSTSNGKDFYDLLTKYQPELNNFSSYKKKMAMRFKSSTGDLKQVSDYEAKRVDSTNDFDRDLARKGGIMRMSN
jgi:hypothetical protein